MTVGQLMRRLIDHGADGRHMQDEILVTVNGDLRPISATYSNGTLILVAGTPITER